MVFDYSSSTRALGVDSLRTGDTEASSLEYSCGNTGEVSHRPWATDSPQGSTGTLQEEQKKTKQPKNTIKLLPEVSLLLIQSH